MSGKHVLWWAYSHESQRGHGSSIHGQAGVAHGHDGGNDKCFIA